MNYEEVLLKKSIKSCTRLTLNLTLFRRLISLKAGCASGLWGGGGGGGYSKVQLHGF